MSNEYERNYEKTIKKEKVKARERHRRRLSDYEHVLQEEVFAIPAHEIEGYLDTHPDIVRVFEDVRESDHRELQDYDPDEFDPISEYGEDPYDEDSDFSESSETMDLGFHAIDKTKATRLSLGQAEDLCDILFSKDDKGHWYVTAPPLRKLIHYDSNSYEGRLVIHFLERKYDRLLKIAGLLAGLINKESERPLEENNKRFFLNFPSFTVEAIVELFKEDKISQSTITKLGSAVFHFPIIGDITLREILDITKNAKTHGGVLSLIDKEDKRNPLKDTEIAERLRTSDRNVKYIRIRYGIPNIYQRRAQRNANE